VAGLQETTRQFWLEATSRFRLVVSELVVHECSAGDVEAAQERVEVLRGMQRMASSDAVEKLAEALMRDGGVPPTEPRDATHVALAASHGIEFLATWNFRHIANAQRRRDIERICRAAGFEPPLICSPESLLLKYAEDDLPEER
jgi:hypothetical protein